MKKENKKMAQERRAREREAAARRAMLKKVVPAVIGTVAAVVVIVGIIVTAGDPDKKSVEAASAADQAAVSSVADVAASSSAGAEFEDMSDKDVLQANKDLVCKEGDKVNIDYVGKIDGVPFAGGDTKGAGAILKLGSGQYIPGFEDQVAGHKPGETFDVVVTFPEDYGAAELAGKKAVFTTTLNGIYKE
jgi:trigger factor